MGLRPPEDKESAPVAGDRLLLVRPDVPEKQRSAEPGPAPAQNPAPSRTLGPVPYPQPGLHVAESEGRHRLADGLLRGEDSDSLKIALDFNNVPDELLTHLRSGGTPV